MEIDFCSSENTAKSEEAIAIIGIACRFPGANDYQQFWANLEQGVNSITEIPSNRWELENFYSPTPDTPNKSISKWGGFIENADKFDAVFFGISPREATRIDPQQRLMLELSWSCIEDAGYSPTSFSGKPVGVFVGVCNFDYKELQEQHSQTVEGHNATGTYICMIPNRVSYLFNFHGPSISVDTACSSSLVAVHQAVRSLQDGECEIALAGGISLLFTPTSYVSFSQLGMLSPQGQCKTFDGQADGYVRGEGAGLILLKPLAKAIEDKDHVYGVIKGSAVNHGGHARTLTSPNAYAQSKVIRSAYTNAGLRPDTVSYIETHGTGTPLGDPIEINALKRAFTQLQQEYGIEGTSKVYCGLGAVKTNLGHLESASGIAGVIKVLLAMKHKKLPAINNFQELNPRIKLDDSPFYIVKETQDWQRLKTKEGEAIPRRAGVSSFGFGGVNAHIVLEEPPETQLANDDTDRPQHLLTLSAKNEKALRELANRYAAFLPSQPEVSLADICFTANTGREHFKYRLAVIAESTVQLQETLSAVAAGKETVEQVSAQVTSDNRPKIAFLFTGQGAQYPDMGRQLYETQPNFRQIIDRCDRLLRPYLEIPLLEVLYPANGKHSPINETAYTQPALFAIEYALAQLWQSWGIKPDVVMGHSVGEYVAACVAGVFSLEDGLKLIAQRGLLMQSLPRDGEMVSVMASEAEVAELLAEEKLVAIAAINGPQSVVISGKKEAVAAITNTLTAKEIKTQKLAVSHAFHSPLMEPMLPDFARVAREVTYSQPKIDLISNVTGELASDEIATPEYWCRHIRQPVRFAASMETLHQGGYELFLECGPKPILLGMGRKCLPEEVGVWLPSLRSGQKDWQQILLSLSELYVRGVAVDWLGFDKDYPRRKVALPTYPFQGERYWIETDANSDRVIKSDSAMTPTLKLLHQGNTQLLTSQLETSGNFSSDEMKLLPKLLEVLVKQHQQQLTEEPTQEAPVIVAQRVETISENGERFELLNQLQEVTESDRHNLLVAGIQKQVAKILKLTLAQIDPQRPINQMGLDSLMAIELRNAIKTNFLADIPMSKFLEGLSVADLADIANEQLNNIRSTPVTSPAIAQKKDTQKTHPLSLGQQDLWFLSQLSPEPYAYNIPLTIHIYSPVDVGAMKKAFQILIDRHPALRTTFSQEEAEIVQKVNQSQEISFESIEVSTWNKQEIQNGVIEAHQSPFDLERGPLLRVKLFTRSPQHHLLALTIHHLIIDGWSLWVLLDELQQLYAAEISGREISLPPMEKDYLDYVYWEKEMLASSVGEQLWSYWKKELSGELPVVDLPTDRPRKAVQTYRGNCHAFKLTQNLTEKLHQFAREQGTTLYVMLLAAFFVMLYRYTSQSELMVGSISAGRTQSEFANTIGTFINQVLLRVSLSGNLKFTEFINGVRQTVLGAIAHQEYPFHLLAEKLQIQRQDYTRYQIFQVCFNLLKPQPGLEYLAELLASEVTETRLKWGELSVASEKTQPLARFDLYVEAIEAKESLVVFLNYNQELFDPSTIARMAEHFETLLEGIVANPTQQIFQLPLLTAAEQNQLLVEWNTTAKQDGNDKCIHQLFEAQVERTPNAVAVVFEELSLTYEQLNSQANQLARHLQSLGVKPEVLVGISVERSPEMVVGMLGILKAGGAYVPLDPAYPKERLFYMLQDAGVSVLLTQEKLLSRFSALSIPVVCLDNCWQDLSQLSTANLASGVNPHSLAYLIYTSGSTGKPKGVMIQHQSLVNFIQGVLAEYGTNPSDRVLQFTSISFDVAAEEIYSCLSCGATLVLRTDEMLTSLTTFIQKCRDWQVTVLYPPTAYWHQLVNELENSNLVLPDSWRIVTIGGEPALPQKIRVWQEIVGDKIQLINSYGPTETTIEATLYKVPGLASADKYWPEVPIGRPLANTQLYILDCDRQLVPIGVPGELHIGGKGLARGYLNRPELTAEKFIPHPFCPGERLYKTGDLACYLPDGSVNFLGRLDEQVKIRGYRVELGEIEQVLAQHSGVREAIVIVREDVPGDKRLVAYLVPDREEFSTKELRQYLLQKLPEYMVPTAFVVLEAMPLTPTGKVNRRILPVPSSDRQSLSEGFVAARDSLELQLTQIWLEVLNLQTVGVRDNFFELGGNSLIALRLMSEIQQQFGKNLPLATLFQSSTIEQQADLISQNNDSPWSPLVTIQPKGTKPAIFCVPGIGGNVIYFYDLASQLDSDRPFYALQALGLDGESQPHQRIEDMAACYIKALQAVQPLGPYILAGHSFGSWVAFEMAKQLQEKGHEIALLAVIDFWAPMTDNNSSSINWDDAKLLTRIGKQIKHLSGTNLEISFEKLVDLEPEEKLNYFKKQLQKVNLLPQKAGTLPIKGMLQVYKSCLQVSYFPEKVNPTSISVFRAIEGFPDWAEIKEPFALKENVSWGWENFSLSSVDIHWVPGDHYTLLSKPHVQVLAEKLKACLDKLPGSI